MKWNKKINVIIILTIICCLLVPNNVVAANKKTTIKLNKSSVTLKKDLSTTLKVTTNEKSSKVKWSTSNKKIVKIKQNGKKVTITGVKNGKATITCKVGSKKKTCKVTVKNTKYTKKEVVSIVRNTLESGGMQWYPNSSEYAQFPEAGPSGGMGWGIDNVPATDPKSYAKKMLEGYQNQGYTYFYIEVISESNDTVSLKVYAG